MRSEKKYLKDIGITVTLFQSLFDRNKVAERLGHLLALHGEQTVVHPGAREGLAHPTRLRELVLMVRKHQIHAAAMDVKRLAQILRAHHRAFDVPAGPARSPGARP